MNLFFFAKKKKTTLHTPTYLFTFEPFIHYYCRDKSFTTFFKTKSTLDMKGKQYRTAGIYNSQTKNTHPPPNINKLFSKNLKAYFPIIADLFSKNLKAYFPIIADLFSKNLKAYFPISQTS